MRIMRVDVFDDPACPWCLIGLKRLDAAIAGLGARARVEVAHHPFLLDASATEAGEDVVTMLTRKFGRPPDAVWDRIEAEAKSAGLDLDMRKQKWRFWSQPALALIAAAAGRPGQHALAVALGRAYYLEAKNIADPEVLTEIAVRHGFMPDEARRICADRALFVAIEAASLRSAEQGVGGVPFFIFDDRFALSGAQPQEVFDRAFASALAAMA